MRFTVTISVDFKKETGGPFRSREAIAEVLADAMLVADPNRVNVDGTDYTTETWEVTVE